MEQHRRKRPSLERRPARWELWKSPTAREEPRIMALTMESRSVTFHNLYDLESIVEDANELTPLILKTGLDEILGVPKDKYKGVAMAFFYLGMCSMLPWNFLISITTFWNYKFRAVNDSSLTPVPAYIINNETSDEANLHDWEHFDFMTNMAGFFFAVAPTPIKPTDLQLSFPSYVAIASYIPGAVTTLLHSGYGQRVSVSSRMLWSISLLLGSFSSLLVLSIPDSDKWQIKFMHVVLMLVVLSNVGVNVLQGALFGVSGRFPSIYAGSVMMGQAFGGLAPSAIAVGMLSLNVEPKVLGPAAFGSVLGLLIVALATERWLSKNRFFLYFTEGKDNPITGDTSDHDAEVDQLSYKDILKRSWIYLLSGFLIYSTTLSIFPALTSLGKSAYLH